MSANPHASKWATNQGSIHSPPPPQKKIYYSLIQIVNIGISEPTQCPKYFKDLKMLLKYFSNQRYFYIIHKSLNQRLLLSRWHDISPVLSNRRYERTSSDRNALPLLPSPCHYLSLSLPSFASAWVSLVLLCPSPNCHLPATLNVAIFTDCQTHLSEIFCPLYFSSKILSLLQREEKQFYNQTQAHNLDWTLIIWMTWVRYLMLYVKWF